MSSGLDAQKLELVFKSRPDILQGIEKEANSAPRIKLFNNIVNFVYEQIGNPSSSEPSLKRRRVDIEPSQNGKTTSNGSIAAASIADVAEESILLEIKGISVSVPQRKKFDLCLTAQHLYARVPNTTTPVQGAIYAWKDIEYAFCVPVPEKAQLQYNYILFPRGSCLSSLSKAATAGDAEPLVFTVSAGAPAPSSIGGPNAGAASSVADTYRGLMDWAIGKCLEASSNTVKLVAADPAKFHSMVKQPHRPNEKAVHVKAFRGAKDGYLFFLENGILWGFKKPLMFLPMHRMAAVSYTSVLQRTFNMVVEVFTSEDGDAEATEEVEFAMLDQEDYGGINEKYVVPKGLQDRSMADQRKAKQELAENAKGGKKGTEGADGANDAVGDDGLTELQRAEQQLQDEEDEEEEDYDPGSDDDSEGSGESSDDDEDDEDGEGGEDSDDAEDDDE